MIISQKKPDEEILDSLSDATNVVLIDAANALPSVKRAAKKKSKQ
jgi:hypothetical protein